MLGYKTRRWAREHGFTHTALMFGLLPCYVRDDAPHGIVVEMRWTPLWVFEKPLLYVWSLCWALTAGAYDEPNLGFMLTGEV